MPHFASRGTTVVPGLGPDRMLGDPVVAAGGDAHPLSPVSVQVAHELALARASGGIPFERYGRSCRAAGG